MTYDGDTAAALREFNAGVARARLHYRVWPISSNKLRPACVDECGRHVPTNRVGDRCAMCASAETRGKS